MKTKQKWFLIAVFAMLLAAPNFMFMRFALDTWDPFFMNFVRFGITSLVTLPILLRHIHKFRGRKLRLASIAALATAGSATATAIALENGPASYVAVIALISPIALVWWSIKLTHERISRRAIAGITLAAIGAMSVVLLPLALAHDAPFVFYPISTIFALFAACVIPLAMVEMRIANQKYKVPIYALFGMVNVFGAVVSLVLWQTLESGATPPMEPAGWAAVLYSAVVVALLSRVLIVLSYKHVNTAVHSTLSYTGTLLAVLLPVAFLNEKLSLTTVIGGILILFGVYLTEHHKSRRHKQHHHHITHL